jgi:hypothetical protein
MKKYHLTDQQAYEIIDAAYLGEKRYAQDAKILVRMYARTNSISVVLSKKSSTLNADDMIVGDVEICRLMPTFAIEYLQQHGVHSNTLPERREAR